MSSVAETAASPAGRRRRNTLRDRRASARKGAHNERGRPASRSFHCRRRRPLVVLWFPESLQDAVRGDDAELSSWSYIVVEEIVDAVAALHRWPWPLADQCGRLFWTEDAEHNHVEAAVPVGVLHRTLYQPNGLTRRPRSGDTFATRDIGAGWAGSSPVVDLRTLLPQAVYDISADAYEAVRLAYQSSVAAVFRGEEHDDVAAALNDLQTRRSNRRAPLLEVAVPSGGDEQQ